MGHPDSALWRAIPPLDTAALISMLQLTDSASVNWAPDTTSGVLWQERIDAIHVRNMMPACTCPDHAVIDSTRFGVKNVYLAAANDSIKIPDRMNVAHNTFLLVGSRSTNTYSPPETMGPPWPGYCFRYVFYKVIRPYRVWGPRVFDATADTLAGEDPWVPSQLTVH
jgi:hypothetical protein